MVIITSANGLEGKSMVKGFIHGIKKDLNMRVILNTIYQMEKVSYLMMKMGKVMVWHFKTDIWLRDKNLYCKEVLMMIDSLMKFYLNLC